MDARRELLKKQEEHDDYKAAQVQKIREVKETRFPKADGLIDELKQTPKYTQLVKYIQYLEHINVGTWCDNCKGAKTIHMDSAEEFVKQLPPAAAPADTQAISQLRADVASLKTITQALNARVSAIESTIAAMQKSSYKVDLVSADELFE